MSDLELRDDTGKGIKFPSGMQQKFAVALADMFMIQSADNVSGDPMVVTLEQIGKALGIDTGGGGDPGNPSTDPVFNTVTISKWLKLGETVTMNDVLFRVFRDGVRTYLRAEDKKNPANELWIDMFAALFTRVVSSSFETPGWKKNLSGGSMYEDEQGNSYLEVDYGVFRKKATFTELVIQKLTHQSGQVLITPVSMEIDRVEETADGYKCYSRDLGHGFIALDQARCQTFNVTSPRYYWRLVVDAGEDHVILSKTDQDGVGDAPMPGDEIVLLGHRDDKRPERQGAIMLDSASSSAPVISIYMKVNGYNLSGKWVGAFGKDPLNPGECGIFCKNGRFENVTIGKGSTGLDNFAEYNELISNVSKASSRSVDVIPDPSPAFITGPDGVVSPATIVLTANENNFDSDLGGLRKWYRKTEEGFEEIPGETLKSISVSSDTPWFDGKNSLSIMYEVMMNDERYSDVTALIKISDGQAGYVAVLDNPFVGVSTSYNGEPKEGQLGVDGRAVTGCVAYSGNRLLEYNNAPSTGQYRLDVKSATGCTASLTPDGERVYIATMTSDMGTVIITVNFEGKQYMDLVFSCAKTYDGAMSSEEIKGEPGEAAYSIDLDNDSILVATQPDGSGGYWGENAVSTATVIKGGRDISDKYNFATSANPSEGIKYTATNNSRTVSVTGMTPDTGFIMFIASPKSSADPDTLNAPTLQKKLSIAKSKQGIQGLQGPGGYVWIVYADDEEGNGISLNPNGKQYIGIAYGQVTPNPPMPLDPDDFQFSLLTGEGVPGPEGPAKYTWIKFSTTHPVTDVSQVYNDGQAPNLRYIGFAWNMDNEKEDTFPDDQPDITPSYYNTTYTWTEYKGKDGTALQVQYSKDGLSDWHDVFRTGDNYMRQKLSDGINWSDPMKIIGEAGADGPYIEYQFAKSDSMENVPSTGWQDGPPPTNGKEFIWMRKGKVTPPETEVPEGGWSFPVVITGPAGTSYWMVADTGFVNVLKGAPSPNVVRFTAKRGSVVDGVTGWSLGYWRTRYSTDNQKSWNTLKTYTSQVPYIDVDMDASWTNVKAELYYDQNMTNICDEEVVLIQDVSGVPGKANYTADLSNEGGTTTCRNDGTGGFFGDNMKTQLRVFYGTENVTRHYSIAVTADAGITFTKNDMTDYVEVQVTAMTATVDSGVVRFTCTPEDEEVEDSVEIVKVFRVNKVRQGDQGEQGIPGQAAVIEVQYSKQSQSGWHNPPFEVGDLYMRQRVDDGEWSAAMRVVGESGPGVEFQFALGATRGNHDDIKESDWQDGPQVPTTSKPYQWMRKRTIAVDGVEGDWEYGIISGENGQDGTDGVDGLPGVAYWISTDATQVSIRDGVARPATVAVKCNQGVGGEGVSDYSCYWYIAVSYDYMESWEEIRNVSSGKTSSYTVTVAKNSAGKWATNYKFIAYYDAAGKSPVDSEIVPVLDNDMNDVTSLDYIKFALKQGSYTDGGLITTTMIRGGYSPTIRNGGGKIPDQVPDDFRETCGMYGGSTMAPDQSDTFTEIQFRNSCPRFYSGGNFEQAQDSLEYAMTQLGLDVNTYVPPGDKCTFAVSDSGILYAQNCFLEGTIMAKSGKIGELIINDDGLVYGLQGSGDSSYYSFRMIEGAIIYQDDRVGNTSQYNRQIRVGSNVLAPSTGISPLMYATYHMESSYDSCKMIYLSVTGGYRNLSTFTGPDAIYLENGDIHLRNGYIVMESNCHIHAYNSWLDIMSNSNTAGINMMSQSMLRFQGRQIRSMSGTDPNITLGPSNNMVVLEGQGSRKKVNLQAGMDIGTNFLIMSSQSQAYDILTTGGEKFIRNGNLYQAVQSNGQDTTFVIKVDSSKWIAAHMPIHHLDTWNP